MQKAVKRYMPIFVLPTFCAFILGFIIPFIMGIWLSFCKFTTVTDAKFIGFSNYKKAFEDTVFRHSFWYTALFAVASLIIVNAVAFALASALTKNMRGTNIFRTIFFMPNLIGGIVLGYIWQFIFEIVFSQLIFNKDGIINIPFFCNMLQDRYKAMIALAILVTWQMAGYMMLIYTTGLNNIPTDLSEAAAIDGANVFQRFRYITIPMLMPSFTIVFFLTLSKCFMLLDPNVALTDGNFNTRLLAMQILRTTKDTNPPDYGLAQAQAVIFFLLIAAVTLTQVVVTKKKEVEM